MKWKEFFTNQRANFLRLSKDGLQFMLLSIYDNKQTNKMILTISLCTVIQLTLEKYDRKQILEMFDV